MRTLTNKDVASTPNYQDVILNATVKDIKFESSTVAFLKKINNTANLLREQLTESKKDLKDEVNAMSGVKLKPN